MNNVKFTRTIDDLGRVVLPFALIEPLGLKKHDAVEIKAVEGGILIAPAAPSCSVCGATEDLVEINPEHALLAGRKFYLCSSCRRDCLPK